ncbi:MAG: hypothetical protein LBN42_02960, partial [Oscillospiraceae bacterium]|nr:hypothetical protein [Oscillospiraceae bacterium]
MLALYIVGGIAILLIVLLEMPLILAVSVKNTTVHIQGIVGFFRVFDSKKFLANMIDKPKKKRKNKHKKRKKVQNNKVKSGKKQSLFSKVGGFGFEDIKLLWARLCKNTRRLCRKTKIYDFRLESR